MNCVMKIYWIVMIILDQRMYTRKLMSSTMNSISLACYLKNSTKNRSLPSKRYKEINQAWFTMLFLLKIFLIQKHLQTLLRISKASLSKANQEADQWRKMGNNLERSTQDLSLSVLLIILLLRATIQEKTQKREKREEWGDLNPS